MRNLIALLLLVTSSLGLNAQTIEWDSTASDTIRGFETEESLSAHLGVAFAEAGEYRWVRSYKENNCNIATAVCDINQCWLENTDSATFYVNALESFDMIFYYYPRNKCCPDNATAILTVYKVDEPSKRASAEFALDLWCASSSVEEVVQHHVDIYPNPALNVLSINSSDKVQHVEFVNIVGETIVVPQLTPTTFDVSKLSKGIYVVNIVGEDRTYSKRFVKQ